MKVFALIALALLLLLSFAQTPAYPVSSFLTEGPKTPNTHYIGEASLNSLLQADSSDNYNIAMLYSCQFYFVLASTSQGTAAAF